jgi:hypothetical protein
MMTMKKSISAWAFLFVFVWCSSAWAAPAHVQSPTPVTASSGTTIAIPFASNVTAGGLLVCYIYANHGISTVADSRSQTFTAAVNVTDNATYSLAIFYYANTTAGADTVTVTFAGAITYASLQCSEYSGVATSSPLDKFASNSQTDPGTGANAVTSGSVTTVTDGQLIVGWSTALIVGTETISAGTGFSGRTNVFGDTLHEDQVQSTAGAIAATFTNSLATADNITLIATFQASAPAPSCKGSLALLGIGGC